MFHIAYEVDFEFKFHLMDASMLTQSFSLRNFSWKNRTSFRNNFQGNNDLAFFLREKEAGYLCSNFIGLTYFILFFVHSYHSDDFLLRKTI